MQYWSEVKEMQTLDIPFEVARELAREFLSSEPFSKRYTLEQVDSDNPSRARYNLKSVSNLEFGVEPYEVGTLVLVKLDEKRTGISPDYLPLQEERMQEELQKIRRAWFSKNRPEVLDTAPGETALRITATPEEVEAIQRAEEAIVEKYHIECETRAQQLSQILESYLKSVQKTCNTTKKKSGGRPRNEDDNWAYEQVRRLGRQLADVYPEWLNRIGDRANSLADPYDSLKKAIKRRTRDERD
jgi:hypothetical protein